MNRMRNVLWGLVLVALGVIFGLNALEITDINLFFDGWWTLFIIVPCGIGLFKNNGKILNLIGVVIGVILLLVCRDILDMQMMAKLIVPIILVISGVAFIFKDAFKGETVRKIKELHKGKIGSNAYCSTFSSQKLNLNGQPFTGAEMTAVFGGIECDMRNAIIEEDVLLEVSAIFGGIDIFVPENVCVKVSSTSIFGGVDEKRNYNPVGDVPTIYINALCLFGGVDVK